MITSHMLFPRNLEQVTAEVSEWQTVQEQVCDKLAVWIAELARSSRVYRTLVKEPAGTAAHHQGANRHLSGGFISRIFSTVLFDSLPTGAPVHEGMEEWSMLKLCEEDGRGGSQQRLDIDPFACWPIPSCAAEERDVSGIVWRRVTGCREGVQWHRNQHPLLLLLLYVFIQSVLHVVFYGLVDLH